MLKEGLSPCVGVLRRRLVSVWASEVVAIITIFGLSWIY